MAQKIHLNPTLYSATKIILRSTDHQTITLARSLSEMLVLHFGYVLSQGKQLPPDKSFPINVLIAKSAFYMRKNSDFLHFSISALLQDHFDKKSRDGHFWIHLWNYLYNNL